MDPSLGSNENQSEEKELSFSISRILQSTCSIKKVEINRKDAMTCRCAVELHGCKCTDTTQVHKINGDGTQETRLPYPWQMLTKQSSKLYF